MSCIPQSRKCKSDLSPAADVVAKSVASGAGGGQEQTPKPKSARKARPKAAQRAQVNPENKTTNTPPPLFRRRPDVPPDESVAAKNFKLIGSGIEGRVYLNPDTGEAIKYVNPARGAFTEDFFGATKRAGDIGIGPKLISVDPEKPVFSMEYLDGYETGLKPDNHRKFLSNVKKAFENNIPLDDLHEENIMSKGQNVMFIDLGGDQAEIPIATRANTLLNKYSWRTMTSDVVQLQSKNLSKADQREFGKIQSKYLRSIAPGTEDSTLSNAELEGMVNRVWELLGI